MLISSCSSSIVSDSVSPDTSSSTTTVVTQLESTTTVVKINVPSELDFVALTTDDELVSGYDLWVNTNDSESENEFGQDILFWFWAPN
jgi:hypothetical protein